MAKRNKLNNKQKNPKNQANGEHYERAKELRTPKRGDDELKSPKKAVVGNEKGIESLERAKEHSNTPKRGDDKLKSPKKAVVENKKGIESLDGSTITVSAADEQGDVAEGITSKQMETLLALPTRVDNHILRICTLNEELIERQNEQMLLLDGCANFFKELSYMRPKTDEEYKLLEDTFSLVKAKINAMFQLHLPECSATLEEMSILKDQKE